jgi:hypothetical protein
LNVQRPLGGVDHCHENKICEGTLPQPPKATTASTAVMDSLTENRFTVNCVMCQIFGVIFRRYDGKPGVEKFSL